MKKMLVYTEIVFVYVSKEQKRKLQEYAGKKLISMTDIVRNAIDEYLKNHPIEDEEHSSSQDEEQDEEQNKEVSHKVTNEVRHEMPNEVKK